MVDRGVHHFHVAGHVGILELRHVRETGLAVVILVAFDVGFIFKIDAVFVAEVIPIWGVGVVAVAHVVDVAALHEEHFFLHLFTRHIVTRRRIVFVAVDALHLDGLAVEVIIASGQSEFVVLGSRLLDFHFAEAHDGGERFNHVALLVLQFAHERIAVWRFGAPRFHLVSSEERGRCGEFAVLAHFSHRCRSRHAWYEGVVVRIEFVFVERIADGVSLGSLG